MVGHVGLAALTLATVAILTAKFIQIPYEFDQWVKIWLIGAAALTILLPVILALVFRPSHKAIATAIDLRMNLRERISSASMMSSEEKATPMGNALWVDATRRAESLDVRDSFPVKFGSHYIRWLAPIALIACSFLLSDPSGAAADSAANQTLTVSQVKNSIEPLIQQVRKQREQAEKDKLDEAELFKNLESQLESLKSKPPKDPTKFMSELTKLQDKLEEKRREMGTGESLKKQLAGLKKLDNGPAEKLAEAMKDGEMEEASEQIQQMMEKMEKGELTKQEQEKLAEQLKEMQKALEEAAKAHEQEKKQVEEQLKQAEESGDMEKAAELAKKLDEMQQKDADMKAAQQMSQSLADAAESLSKGDQKGASQSLSEMKQQLSKMAKNAKNSQSLQELAENMNNSKRSSMCKGCSGEGCKACNGKSNSDKVKYSKYAKGEGKALALARKKRTIRPTLILKSEGTSEKAKRHSEARSKARTKRMRLNLKSVKQS